MSIEGGRRSWERRLAIREDSPLAPLLDVLNTTIGTLMAPGLDADEVRRLRALTYTCSVAARVIELAEYADIVDELDRRLQSLDGTGLQWPRGGGDYAS